MAVKKSNIFKVYPKAKLVETLNNGNKLYMQNNDITIQTDKDDIIIEVIDVNSLLGVSDLEEEED